MLSTRNGLSFRGQSSDYIDISLAETSIPFTLEAIINIPSTYSYEMNLWEGAGQGDLDSYISLARVPYLYTTNTDDSRTELRSDTALTPNVDHLLSFTFDTGWRKMYIDGVLVAESAKTTKPFTVTKFGISTAYPNVYFKGILRQLRRWNIARTAEQMLADPMAFLTGEEDGLINFWNLRELEGSTAHDITGDTDGTVYGASWVTLQKPVYEPLNIPTYVDDFFSVAHPSVVYSPDGWNGYKYWMCFTPTGLNENPSIVVSDDGYEWAEPPGISNPIVPAAEVTEDGYNHDSDPDLVVMPDGNLAAYFRFATDSGSIKEAIYRKTSSDGITWSARAKVLETPDHNQKLMSPSIVVEDDNTYSMFTINATVGDNTQRVEKRTSPDGLTWSEPVTCVLPFSFRAWHIEVVKGATKYHAVINSDITEGLYYFSSDDGINWQGSTGYAVPLSGLYWDRSGLHRSAFIVLSEDPLRIKYFLTGIDGYTSYRVASERVMSPKR